MMYDIAALGEFLVDFVPYGVSEAGEELLEANPGGAPCNVLSMAAKLGLRTAFLGKVGNDHFGLMLKQAAVDCGVEVKSLRMDSKAHTTLAFVHLDEKGDRDFSFYRDPGADQLLKEEELDLEILTHCRVFHFGSISLTHNPVRNATKRAIETAKAAGALISFDPNLRPPLWSDLSFAKEMIEYGMSQCNILKIAGEELEFITGIQDALVASEVVARQFSIPLVFITMGAKGSMYRYGELTGFQKTYTDVQTIDTTGAGDAFCACVLSKVLQSDLEGLNRQFLDEALDFANAAASAVTTRRGALKAMPELSEIEALRFRR